MAEKIDKKHGLEKKEEVFYARCRPNIKKALYLQMDLDGFSSMTDWFEQFVISAIVNKKKKMGKNGSNKRKLQKRN